MDKEIKINGHSSSGNLSDPSAFYANYWTDGDLVSKVSKAKTNYILNDFCLSNFYINIMNAKFFQFGLYYHLAADTNHIFDE